MIEREHWNDFAWHLIDLILGEPRLEPLLAARSILHSWPFAVSPLPLWHGLMPKSLSQDLFHSQTVGQNSS